MYYELTDQFEVPSAIERTWSFFTTAENLARITPPWLSFTVATPWPVVIGADSVLDYTIRWMGVPLAWRTRIIDFSPPRQFIDLQVRGPYAMWLHQHTFEAAGDQTLCSDRVIYELPLGPVGRMAHALAVRGQLLDIFRYRRTVIAAALDGLRPRQADVMIVTM
jgi:ligand-binding SRPBCC domain-containing protein